MSAVTLTAVIRCKAGMTDRIEEALIAVGRYVQLHEPDTLDYRVIRSAEDATLLLTQEKFKDQAAMQAHNDGAGSKAFFAAAEGLIDSVEIIVGPEVFAAR